jgi:hypothetical protein
MTRILSILHLLLLLAPLAGCGGGNPHQGTVQGLVTLDTKPLDQGCIAFAPINGTHGMVVGGQISNGHYRLSTANGPAVGWNRVEIRSSRKTGRMIAKGLGGSGEMVEEQTESVPARFNSTSTLTIEIKPGDNVGNFEVTSK